MKFLFEILFILFILSQLMLDHRVLTQTNIVYKCDFDDANSLSGCDGQFSYSTDSQQSGVVNSIQGVTSELTFDLTDLTSISIN